MSPSRLLAAGNAREFEIRFEPSSPGIKNATFTNSPTETYSVWISTDLEHWDPVPGHLAIPGTGTTITRSLNGFAAGTRIFVQVRQDP